MIAAAVICVLAHTATAQNAAAARHRINIESAPIATALKALAAQTGLQLVVMSQDAGTRISPAVHGNLTDDEALALILKDSGLTYQRIDEKTVAIRSVSAPERDSTSRRDELDEVVVTGSHIRGVAPSSPMIVVDQRSMREEGLADLGEVVRHLPQNFGGGQNPGVLSAGSPPPNSNLTGGSALNLRGLGADATLTLLNGHRLAYEGYSQAVDISAIPIAAVDRIEIVPDGASAVYGSDAVAGVANVVLKRDFDGMAVSARYGAATDGGLGTTEYSATLGTTWGSGGVLATYDKADTSAIFSDRRRYTEYMSRPTSLYPESHLDSGLLSLHQSLGAVAEVRLDALRTRRSSVSISALTDTYYVSVPDTTVSLLAPSIQFSLPGRWSVSLSTAYSTDESAIRGTQYITSTNAFDYESNVCYCNRGHSYEIEGEGPLPSVAGVEARIAVGAGYRKDVYDLHGLGGYDYRNDGTRSSRYGYLEAHVPFIAASDSVSWARRLALTAAVRSEDYDTFGRVTTPKAGLVYDPNKSLTFKLSWAKSFKTPTLIQTTQTPSLNLFPVSFLGGSGYAADAAALIPYGGNADLSAERARTWTVGMALHPEALPNFQMELSYSDIDYQGRVVLPINSIFNALRDPVYRDFVDYEPTSAKQAALFQAITDPLINYTGAPYDPSKVVAIINDRYTNAASQLIRTIDLSGSYRFDLSTGRLTVRGSASWLRSTQQNSASGSMFDLSGTLFNPPHLNARVGAVWSLGGITASSFVNYGGRLQGNLTGVPVDLAPFVTVDAAVGYDTGERDAFWSNLQLSFVAQNLFDRQPALFTPISADAPNYDSTNYSSIGRFVGLTVAKRW